MATTPVALTNSAWVDLGATPLVVCVVDDRDPAVLVVADAAPSLTTPGIIVSSQDQDGIPVAGNGQHVWAKALNSRTTVIALPYTGGGASEAHLGEIGGNIGLFQGAFGPVAATNFVAGQAMSAPIEVTNMARVDNGTGLLVGGTMELAAANSSPIDLVVFSRLPTGTYAAGTAFSLAATDRGFVSKVLKLTDWTALGAAESLGEVQPGPKFFSCRETTAGKLRSLWVVPIARGAISLPAGGPATATLTMRAARN